MAQHSTPVPGRSTGDASTRVAAYVADLAPKSVAVVGDDAPLTAALLAAGVSAGPAEAATPITAELAVVCCARATADQVFPALREGVTRVLLVGCATDDASSAPLADWITIAAGRGYFRVADQPAGLVADAVVLEAGEPTPAELVARYEQLVADVPALTARVLDLRHELLTAQDHAIGCEGEIGQLRARTAEQEALIEEMYNSTTWHVGTKVIRGAARAKRVLKR